MRAHSMVTWRVRRAVDADADRVGEITVAGWRHAYADFLPAERLAALDPAAVAASRREIVGRGERSDGRAGSAPDPAAVLVAEDDRGIQGCVVVGSDGSGAGQLSALYVDPPAIGTGAGRALHDAAVAHLAAAGFRRATLWIYADNTPAFGFYAHLGWRQDGERVHPPEWSAPAVRWVRATLDL